MRRLWWIILVGPDAITRVPMRERPKEILLYTDTEERWGHEDLSRERFEDGGRGQGMQP